MTSFPRVLSHACLAATLLLTATPNAPAQTVHAPSTATAILVHGAFADGSSWRKVIPQLQARGLNVIAVQNPLISLADDVAATKRAIDRAAGPVILVGHSWAGAVITEAGTDPKVAALVYVAAVAPDAGQSVNDLLKDYPPSPAAASIKPDAAGFLSITADGMRNDFAQDLPATESAMMAVTQTPIAAAAFAAKVDALAWQTKPSWYIVAGNDRAMSPKLERAMAEHIKAKIVTLPTSHVVMLAKPSEVAAVIVEAAKTTAGK
jgi:pimeloyl-ACP methyl ester carboxylesterase